MNLLDILGAMAGGYSQGEELRQTNQRQQAVDALTMRQAGFIPATPTGFSPSPSAFTPRPPAAGVDQFGLGSTRPQSLNMPAASLGTVTGTEGAFPLNVGGSPSWAPAPVPSGFSPESVMSGGVKEVPGFDLKKMIEQNPMLIAFLSDDVKKQLFGQSGTTKMKAPNGTVEEVPSDKLAAAMKAGYKVVQ